MHINTGKAIFALLLIPAALWAADDPLMGTWKLNVAKSQYNPGPGPKSTVSTYEPYGKDGFKFISDTVNAQGKSSHVEYAADYDGKDHAIVGDPARDANSATRVDLRTHVLTNKKDGKVTTTSRRVISPDGKTLTITTTGTNPQGQPVQQVQVFDKQ